MAGIINNGAEVTSNYKNLFNRTGSQIDQEGLDYWNKSGLTGNALTTAMKGSADQIAQGTKVDGTAVSNYASNGTRFDVQGLPVNAPAPNYAPPPAATPAATYAPTPAYTPTTAAVSNYTATGVATTPGMSVQHRMTTMLDPNDPFNQAAATQAKQTFNQRGLLNSSMAATGTTDSIIRNALSIAQPDAAMEANNAQFSANAQNQAGQFNSGAANTASLQSNTQAYDAYKINLQQAFTQQNMSLQQANDLQKMATANGYDLTKMSVTQINDMIKLGVTTGSSERIAAAGNATSIANTAANNATSTANTTANNASSERIGANNNATSTANTNANNATSIINNTASNATTLANTKLNGDNQLLVNAAQNKYQILLQNSSGATTLLRDYTNAIANIQNNNGMDSAAKQTAINNLGQTFDLNMNALKNSAGTSVPDFSSFLDFGKSSDATPAAPAASSTSFTFQQRMDGFGTYPTPDEIQKEQTRKFMFPTLEEMKAEQLKGSGISA